MMVESRFVFQNRDVRLSCVDFGGDGTGVLLLHGLCGCADEWRATAAWLRDEHHVFALDQRGHGSSKKAVKDYTLEAYATDAIAAIEHLQEGPMTLIGQSMGGVHALIAAARRPDLCRALIVIEATAWSIE